MGSERFLPSGPRAARLVSCMQERLGKSILHVAERASPVLGRDFTEIVRPRIPTAGGPGYVAPALFALHSAALSAAEDGDTERLTRVFEEIAARSWSQSRREITDLAPAAFDPLIFELYRSALEVDASTRMHVATPSPEISRRARERIEEALAILRRSLPELAAEVDAILAQIVLVTEGADRGQATFAGGSSFEIWGAIFLNTDAFEGIADLLVGIVHEVAHLVLFAEAIDEPLVLNDPDETYPSPLRRDPRPMDGIFHATFVTARMHLATLALARHEASLGRRSAKLLAEIVRYEQLFGDSLATIERHGRLTETGRKLMSAAADYMRAESEAAMRLPVA